MLRLIDTDLARARDLELGDSPPILILDFGHELDALGLQILDGPLDVVAHEEQGMVAGSAAPARAGVDRELARR